MLINQLQRSDIFIEHLYNCFLSAVGATSNCTNKRNLNYLKPQKNKKEIQTKSSSKYFFSKIFNFNSSSSLISR